MTEKLKTRCKQGLTIGGMLLAGLLVVQGVSPCTLLQSCGTRGTSGSEECTKAVSTSPDDVLVTVNGTPITRAEVDAELLAAMGIRGQRMSKSDVAAARAELAPRAIEMLVTRALLQQAADVEDVTVSDVEVAKAIERVSSKLPAGATLDDLKRSLGMSEEQWTAELTQNLRIEKLLGTHGGNLTADPTDADVEAFYAGHPTLFEVPETVEARHILISVDRDADEATRAEKQRQADAVRERLMADNAESFEAVAKEASDCPSAARGGHLGEFARGQMVPAFEAAAFSQDPGAIGPVVETQFGYHIIKVENHTAAKTLKLDEVRERIADRLQAERRSEAFEAYVSQLRSNASIQYADESKAT